MMCKKTDSKNIESKITKDITESSESKWVDSESVWTKSRAKRPYLKPKKSCDKMIESKTHFKGRS